MWDVPSGQTCGVFCPGGKAPGMASVSKWLPNPDWYCKGGRPGTALGAWEGAVVVVPPEEEEEEAMFEVMSRWLRRGLCDFAQPRAEFRDLSWRMRWTRTGASL